MGAFKGNTFNLTSANSPYRITAAMNIRAVTYRMSTATGDAGTVTGSLTIKDSTNADQASQAVALGPGEGDTLIPQSPAQPLDGWEFSVSQGTMRFIFAQ